MLTADIQKVRERWTQEARARLEADPVAEVSSPDASERAAEFGFTGDPAERLLLRLQWQITLVCTANPRAGPSIGAR